MIKKILIGTLLFVITAISIVALAGFIKFNILADDIYIELEDGTVVPYDEYEIMDTKDLIVITAPSVRNKYYKDNFQDIIDFDVAYANAVLGKDEIRILVDSDTKPYFSGKVPDEILVEADIEDIWMRDFTTVNPNDPVQFRYTAASFDNIQSEADFVQKSFVTFTKNTGVTFPKTKYSIDGGNIVDNYAGRIVTTTRFLEDNDLTKEEGVAELKHLLGATEVAILPPDDDVLAHSDGMVMFVEENTILVNGYEEPFRTEVIIELETAFPDIKIVEIEAVWDEESWDGNIASACGINVNSVVTTDYIYVPHFGDESSDVAIETIAVNTSKRVVPVPANNVCKMGGSVRCLSWQLSGKQAELFLSKLK